MQYDDRTLRSEYPAGGLDGRVLATLLGHLDNGLGFYRFSYNGSDKAYVGVIAQEVEAVRPDAVTRGRDGYLRVYYDKLGIKFRTYQDWLASAQKEIGVVDNRYLYYTDY